MNDQGWLSPLAFATEHEAEPNSSERHKSCRRGELDKWMCSHQFVLPVKCVLNI